MWELEIAGISLYHIIAWLYVYSFLGWLWESAFISAKQRKPVNRGFAVGPVCTVYGVGAVSAYLILKPFAENLLMLFFGGVVVATLLEYLTGVLMEAIFHSCWWDYSRKRFNFQGKICLGSSAAWGVFIILVFKVIHPFVEWIVGLVSQDTGEMILIGFTVIYAADFTYSMMSAINLGQKLGRLQQKASDLAEYFLNTRIFTSAEEFREKLEENRASATRRSMRERVDVYQERLIEYLESKGLVQYKDAVKEKLSSLRETYTKALEKGSFGSRRLLKAYPSLSRIGRLKIKRNKNKKKRERKE